MLALTLESSGLKLFMSKLLAENLFDGFEFRECVVISFIRFELDGRKQRDSSEDEPGRLLKWKELRPYVYNIVKGSAKPKSMKFVLSLPEEELEELDANAKALFLNIIFDNETVLLTTGCAVKSFSLDKSTEGRWDAYVESFLNAAGLPFVNAG